MAKQYSERLRIAAKEAAKRAAELRESEPPAPSGEEEEPLGGGTSSHSATPTIEANISRSGSCNVSAM